jgi:hypothetical protein
VVELLYQDFVGHCPLCDIYLMYMTVGELTVCLCAGDLLSLHHHIYYYFFIFNFQPGKGSLHIEPWNILHTLGVVAFCLSVVQQQIGKFGSDPYYFLIKCK